MHAARTGQPDASGSWSLEAIGERQAPPQLSAKQLEEVAPSTELDELHLQPGRGDLNLRPRLERIGLLAVAGKDPRARPQPTRDVHPFCYPDRPLEHPVR